MKVNENQSLEVFRASSDKYECLVTEICYEGEPIIRINQDEGANVLKAEILIEYNELEFNVKLLLKDLVKALRLAKIRLTNSVQKESYVNCNAEILSISDKNYSYLTSIIKYQGHTIAQINQDNGIDNLEIELFLTSNVPEITLMLPINDLSSILENIENKLIDCTNQSFIKF